MKASALPGEPIETLFLDAGGVLVFPNFEKLSQALVARGVQVSGEQLAAAEPHAKRTLDVAEQVKLTNDEQRGWAYFNLVLEHAGVERDARTDAALQELYAYHQLHNFWEWVPQDVVPALERLRARFERMVVVSNANGSLHVLFERLGLLRFFDLALDSHREGVEKPDPRLFQVALARSGGRRETTLHVGDLYHVDVAGARAAGLRAVLLDAAGLYADADCPRVRSLGELADAF